jgi:hypothetical protein
LIRRLATGCVLATLAFIVLLGVRPIRVETIVAGYALTLAAIVLAGLTAAITDARESAPSHFEAQLTRERVPPTRPPELVRMERELTLGSSSALHFHARLAPLLASIAEARGITLDELKTRPPDDPTAPGVPLRRIRALIERLESA